MSISTDRQNAALTARLRAQIQDLRGTLDAIRSGGVDAVIVGEPGHEHVYTLSSADEPYRLIVEHMGEGAAAISPAGLVLFANPRLAQMLGRDMAELTGRPVTDLVAVADRPALAQLLAVSGGQPTHAELNLASTRGPLPTTLAASSIDIDDTPLVVLIATDLSAQKHVQAELLANQRRAVQQASMLDLANDAVLTWDQDGRITYWNRGAETTYGYPREQAIGAVVHDLLQTAWTTPQDELLQLTLDSGQWEGELTQRRADGSRLVVDSRWAPHLDSDGTLLGIMEINRDATARLDAEAVLAQRAAELEDANRELARSNQDLEQFAYAASHDLAEPLRAIRLPLSMLERRYEGRLGPDADEYIGYAVDGCQRMQKMIDDLLQWSRVGRLETERTPVDCGAVMTDVLASMETTIADAHATVTVGPLPVVIAEPTQLFLVFQNLVSNAVKFVPPDVTPEVAVAAESVGPLWRITVTDNGIGIDPRHRDRVFGMFRRLHPGDVYPGSGIGLALVKKAVERQGGQVGVEDTPSGHGSQFWFTLPTGASDQATSDADHAHNAEPGHH